MEQTIDAQMSQQNFSQVNTISAGVKLLSPPHPPKIRKHNCEYRDACKQKAYADIRYVDLALGNKNPLTLLI